MNPAHSPSAPAAALRARARGIDSAALLSVALSARLAGRCSPDDVVHAFESLRAPVPLVVASPWEDEDLPTGLLLWERTLRSRGVERTRLELIHPALPLRVPRMERTARRAVAGAPALGVLESSAGAQAVCALSADGALTAVPCAEVVFSTVDEESAAEAARHLREVVMAGLDLVESSASGAGADAGEELRGGLVPMRDWQAELAGADDSPAHEAFAALLPDPQTAHALLTALDIHARFLSVPAPRAVEPAEYGAMLADLHTAAARFAAALSREL